MMENMLEVNNIHTYIGQYHILQGVSFTARKGEVTVLYRKERCRQDDHIKKHYGARTLPSVGTIRFKGREIHYLETHQIAGLGMVMFPRIKDYSMD